MQTEAVEGVEGGKEAGRKEGRTDESRLRERKERSFDGWLRLAAATI